MDSSVEVRWFLQIPQPERPIIFPRGVKTSIRTDWYACSHSGCGMKIRDGKLEMKLLHQNLGFQNIGTRSGKFEEWKKWTFDVNSKVAPSKENLLSTGWVAITKKRSLLVYSVNENAFERVSSWTPNGCQLEWTELTIDTQKWLTIGLDAFGSEIEPKSTLKKAAQILIPKLPDYLQLDGTTSCSYPEWIFGLKTLGSLGSTSNSYFTSKDNYFDAATNDYNEIDF